ncbi:MAG: sigma-54 factor interaction domain-containing protein [Planctomycetes bacterium]|nr:sigma-54 factor interaction domain-containing protein [Planctomycetota bacterium]
MTKRQSLSGYLEQIKSALNKQDWAHAKRLSKISAKKLSSFHYTPFEEYMLYRLSGLVYYHLAEYSRSIDVFYKAYLIALKHHFEPIDIAFTSLLIGNNFLEMRNISQALNQLQKVEQYYQKPGNKSLLSDKMYPATYIGLAWCYLQKNDLEKVREIIDAKLSLPNLFQSNKLARIDYYHLKGEYQVVLKEYNMATQSFQECVKLSKELNFQQGLITGRINLAIINLLEKRLDLAIPALNNIFDDARRLKLNELICESGLLLSKCYSLKNMSHKAEMIEKRIKLIINKLDSVWLYEKTREFEKLFRQIQSATKESTLSPAILADTLNQHIKTSNYKHIVGKSVPMQEVYQLIEKVAPTDLPILIQGETGTGKELIANAIHTNSLRADKIYFPFNCGVLPETLIESSLFGHTKGSFTGAVEDKKGYIELASDGTLFIDEVANMSPSMQQKLLRVMEEKLLFP